MDELREKHHFAGARVAQPASWYSFASGIAGITYTFSFALQGKVRAAVYIFRGDAAENKAIFDAVKASQPAIEREFGEPLQWERLDDRKASRVAVYRGGSIEEDDATLDDIRAWGIERCYKIFQRYKDVGLEGLTDPVGGRFDRPTSRRCRSKR